jgi:hypothetical protein
MKRLMNLCCIVLTLTAAKLFAVQSNTFIDYQNFNRGYCPTCNCYPCQCGAHDHANTIDELNVGEEDEFLPSNLPEEEAWKAALFEASRPSAICNPPNQCKPDPCLPAPICACECGLSVVSIALAVAIVAATGALIVSLTSEVSAVHSHTQS